MRRVRALLVAVGTLVVVAAGFLWVAPGAAGQAVQSALIDVAGNDYVVVAALGVLALAVALLALLTRGVRGVDQASPPDPEGVRTAPRPGAEFDDLVADAGGLSAVLPSDGSDRVRERLRAAAIGAVMRAEGLPESRARTAIERHEWTDDEVAAAFVDADGGPGVGGRLRAVARGESWLDHATDRTVRAVERTAEGGIDR